MSVGIADSAGSDCPVTKYSIKVVSAKLCTEVLHVLMLCGMYGQCVHATCCMLRCNWHTHLYNVYTQSCIFGEAWLVVCGLYVTMLCMCSSVMDDQNVTVLLEMIVFWKSL